MLLIFKHLIKKFEETIKNGPRTSNVWAKWASYLLFYRLLRLSSMQCIMRQMFLNLYIVYNLLSRKFVFCNLLQNVHNVIIYIMNNFYVPTIVTIMNISFTFRYNYFPTENSHKLQETQTIYMTDSKSPMTSVCETFCYTKQKQKTQTRDI